MFYYLSNSSPLTAINILYLSESYTIKSSNVFKQLLLIGRLHCSGVLDVLWSSSFEGVLQSREQRKVAWRELGWIRWLALHHAPIYERPFSWQKEFTCDTVWKKLCKDLYLSQIFKKNLKNHLSIHAQGRVTVFSHISRHLKLLPGFLDGCPQLESTYIQGLNIHLRIFLSTPSHTRKTYIQFHKRYSTFRFLRAIAILRKVTISFVMSVRTKQLGSRWTNLHKILSALFRKSVEKVRV